MKYLAALSLFVFLQGSGSTREPVTIYLAGDSTMAQKLPEKRPETGWGEALQEFFVETKVNPSANLDAWLDSTLWGAVSCHPLVGRDLSRPRFVRV